MTRWPAVLDELMRTRRAALVGYATLLTGDSAIAEDIVQDAIIKSFSRGRAFNHINQADAYVRRAIVSVFIDRVRRDERFRNAAPHMAASSAAVPPPEPAVDLDRALAALSPQLRAVVVLRFLDDLTVSRIADRMGLAEGTVKRYLHEAQGQLAAVYRADFPVPPAEHEPTISVVAHNERALP